MHEIGGYLNASYKKKEFSFKKVSKIIIFIFLSATALATAAAVIAMSAILPAAPTKDNEAIQTEFNSWPMFPLEKTRGGYTKVFAAEAVFRRLNSASIE